MAVEPSIRSALDTQIIADQERAIARLRAEIELLRHHDEQFEELIVEKFNPRDDDSVTSYSVIEDVAEFIEGLPCTCEATEPQRIYVEARELQVGDVEQHYGCVENDEYDWADLPIERVEIVGDVVLVWYGIAQLWGTTLLRPFRFKPDARVWVRRGAVVLEVEEPCARCRMLGRINDEPVTR